MNQPDITPLSRNTISCRAWAVATVFSLIIIADQALKIYVKTHFFLGEDYPILSWFQLKFIENNGMAFGMELGSKIALTLGRIAAVILFFWFISKIIKAPKIKTGFFIIAAMITAGAFGNIIDCIFYGQIFNNPYPPEIAQLFPASGGYAGWFEGRVVDMLYFPICEFNWPDWIPFIGGQHFEFFQYIFNIADASICVAVFLLIFFYSNDFGEALLYVKNSLKKSEDPKLK